MKKVLPQLSGKQASVFAIVVFIITVLLAYFLPGYSITLSGLLVVIFLSVFVKGKDATIIAGVLSSFIVIIFLMVSTLSYQNQGVFPEFFFILLLILFTTLIVLYIKQLWMHIQFDQSHMTSLFENATEGIILTNSRGLIVLVNPAASRMFDYDADDLVGKPVEILLPTRYRSGHVQLRDGFYHKPQNREMGSGRDLYAQRKDGSNFPVEVSLSHYKQKEETFVIAFVVDITHRKEIERSMLQQREQLEKVTNDIRKLNAELEAKVEERTVILKEALQRLEQSHVELSEALDKERQLNEIKSRFVSMASHEFRTPLSTVLSSASLLAKYTSTEEQPKRDRHIEKIRGSVKHLNDLLEDFLSLGKLDEGKIGAQFSEVNLHEWVSDTVDEMKGLLKNQQQLVYHHSGNDFAFTDKKLVKNILINLISNAIKFSPEEGTVTVNSFINDGTAAISVKDEGIGISEEDQEHLFTSFFRGKNALNIQGTGLGLHIVKRYLELIGGSINLQSRLNKGTTITFNIPVNKNDNGENNPCN
jgi:PAS domain S-box-containing protein